MLLFPFRQIFRFTGWNAKWNPAKFFRDERFTSRGTPFFPFQPVGTQWSFYFDRTAFLFSTGFHVINITQGLGKLIDQTGALPPTGKIVPFDTESFQNIKP